MIMCESNKGQRDSFETDLQVFQAKLIQRLSLLSVSCKFEIFYIGLSLYLKGLSQGHNAIFKGLKMTFGTKILRKKLYHVNQRQKYYKLCFENFSLWWLFLTALLIAVNFKFSDAPSAQDDLYHRVLRLVPLLAPTPLPKMCTNLKDVGARSGARQRARWATLIDYPEHWERH